MIRTKQIVTLVLLFIVVIGITMCMCRVVNADEVSYDTHMHYIWNSCTDEQRKYLPVEYQAAACGMTVYEFTYLARTVEAESDRSSNIEAKTMIAAVIINRMNDSRFANSIAGVLNESGQFETTYNGWCTIESTVTSRWAVVEAQRSLTNGTIPNNVLYFNSIGYNRSWTYGYYGGNYFMCA